MSRLIGNDRTRSLRFLLTDLVNFLSEAGGVLDDDRLILLTKNRYADIGAEVEALGGLHKDTRYEVILASVSPNNKIGAIKAVRAVTGLGLKEAKDLVDIVAGGGMKTIVSVSQPTEVEFCRRELTAAGCAMSVNEVPQR